MLLAQISDLHIKRPGALAYRRVDTAAYLSRCVAALNALEPRPDAVIVTGDLVDQGEPEQYEHLKALLAPLAIPYYLLVGNHDLSPAAGRAHAIHEFDKLQVPYVKVLLKPELLRQDHGDE